MLLQGECLIWTRFTCAAWSWRLSEGDCPCSGQTGSVNSMVKLFNHRMVLIALVMFLHTLSTVIGPVVTNSVLVSSLPVNA